MDYNYKDYEIALSAGEEALREFFERFVKQYGLDEIFINSLIKASPEEVKRVIEREKDRYATTIRGAIAAITARNQSHGLGKYFNK